MSYRFEFQNAATGVKFMVRARDADAAIRYVEQNCAGVFDCLAQYADQEPLGEPLMTWASGEP